MHTRQHSSLFSVHRPWTREWQMWTCGPTIRQGANLRTAFVEGLTVDFNPKNICWSTTARQNICCKRNCLLSNNKKAFRNPFNNILIPLARAFRLYKEHSASGSWIGRNVSGFFNKYISWTTLFFIGYLY